MLSESIRHVLGQFRVFGKHTEPSTSTFSFRMHQELDTCFPSIFRTCRMLPECFPNTSRIHMDATFRWSMKIILNMHNTFFELPNAVPYASVRSRTAHMLLEHTECFPNMIRTPKFLFGKQIKWHSGQYDRAICKNINKYTYIKHKCTLNELAVKAHKICLD